MHVAQVVALLAITLGALFHVIVVRYGEARRVSDNAREIASLARDIHLELVRDARLALAALAAEHKGAGRPDAAQAASRLAKLRDAGFLIDIPRLGADGKAEFGIELPSARRPGLPLHSLALASRQVAATQAGDYLIPLERAEMRTLARLLGSDPEVVSVAIRVPVHTLEQAAQLHLQPGVEIQFHPGSLDFEAVRLAKTREHGPRVERVAQPVPHDVQADAGAQAISLADATAWPGLLLFGGREIKHYLRREETRDGQPVQVFYLRDDINEDGMWRGVSLAIAPAFFAPSEPLSTGRVAGGAVSLVAAWVVVLARLRSRMIEHKKT
jgi:hypothetical protein